ncbi:MULTISPECIES: glycosyltransferase [Methylobacterium]|uniref:glycosyltransferase n=1 Tax=Methylobacterium TaxID=407 RepID=UPI0013ED5E79|nr:glycosyltransferase [Methylobacterium sp. DB0501]NGM37065.1 glycosyltransferase family 2 protein [Methylobacterium sp. DB0501]
MHDNDLSIHAVATDTDDGNILSSRSTYSNYSSEIDRYVLQPVIMTAPAFAKIPGLYYTALIGGVRQINDFLFLNRGCKIGFNNYINSFYASYWHKYTNLRAISLSGKVKGTGILHLFRSTPNGRTYSIGSYPIGEVESENTFHIHFNLFEYMPSDGGPGRYFFDIEATTDLEVKSLAFCAFTPPATAPSFSIGICTYRKEEYVTNIALNLSAYTTQHPGIISDIIIVNNDRSPNNILVIAELAESNDIFHLIDQSNIGGAGGFARTLDYSMEHSNSDHHIFMDDDVYIDTNVLERLWAFVAYSKIQHVIGGQMMDMHRPHILYEGGAKLDYWGFLQKIGDNIDASSSQEATFYDKVRDVDYNAWWFACVPKSKAANIGLPLNIFIRGDDFEYGLRLRAKQNVTTVSLPGLFIWHEPFSEKTASWLEYYNWRNRFIICSLYADREKLDIQPVEMLRDILVDCLESGREEVALAMCLAIVDFLAGPKSVLAVDAERLHEGVRASLKRLSNDTGSFAAILKDRLQGDTDPSMRQVVTLLRSPRLGGRQRTSETIRWAGKDYVGAVDRVLALYEANVDAAMSQWKQEAHGLATREAWSALYWKPKSA